MENPFLVDDQDSPNLYRAAAADTYCLVWYGFEQFDWQGWTVVDYTAQVDTFFHVDDFNGLGGGNFGRLVALEGSKSVWCGARPGNDEYMCNWWYAPGYGNDWSQFFWTNRLPFTGKLTFQYHAMIDCEPGYDEVSVEFDLLDEGWVQLDFWDGVVDTVASHDLYLAQLATKFRFHFTSDGAWSDQDGLWNTDGACILDEITITDAYGVVDYEDFEGAGVGDLEVGVWHADVETVFGNYAGLMNNLTDKDPCNHNMGTQIVFFIGSDTPSPDYSELYDTPFCRGPGGITSPCQDEACLSPVIDRGRYSTGRNEIQDAAIPPGDLADLNGTTLRFTVYRDLPMENLVFYQWRVREIVDGCPMNWQDRTFLYFGEERSYLFESHDISDLVASDSIQVSFRVMDMCDEWYLLYGWCAEHTPSPWFDNVRVYRYKSPGPHWYARDIDLFQDNFPSDEYDIESFSRADMANDIAPMDDPVIRPGDSVVVSCSDRFSGGLDTLTTGPYSGHARVYCHLKCSYIGAAPAKPVLEGPLLEGDWGHYLTHLPGGWNTFLCDSAFYSSGHYAADKFCLDLNDSLFTRGYSIEYYFEAYNLNGERSTLPSGVDGGAYYEFTILPTLISDILYVDDFHGRGTPEGMVQTYFDPTFRAVIPPGNQPDRYDVNGPSSMVSNGLGGRAHLNFLDQAYKVIIWDSGNLNYGTISDGTAESDKSNDCQMLIDWLNLSDHRVGLWILGDAVADDLYKSLSPGALILISQYCGVQICYPSYFELTGGLTAGGTFNPLIQYVPNPALLFTDAKGPIQYYAFGGCPLINEFDVIEATGPGVNCLEYPECPGGTKRYAGVYTDQLNDRGYARRTVWMGQSLMYIRAAGAGLPIVRNRILAEVLDFFQSAVNPDKTRSDELPRVFALGQNYPNPFNPVTTIKLSLPHRSHVSLRVYNVAGQLVKTLAHSVMDAGVRSFIWDGTNNTGNEVASGVYFYQVKAGSDYEKTRKMILLR